MKLVVKHFNDVNTVQKVFCFIINNLMKKIIVIKLRSFYG